MPDNVETDFKRVTRRAVLGTTAAMAATPALAQVCPIGPPAHDKGPRVWMGMDQVELDAGYDQSVYSPLMGQVLKRFATGSDEARAHLGAPKRLGIPSSGCRNVAQCEAQVVPVHRNISPTSAAVPGCEVPGCPSFRHCLGLSGLVRDIAGKT